MLKDLRYDLRSSIVVFFVALPLSLGIALASGAPLFSGILAGIVGGIFVGYFSQSTFSVSGPSAGVAGIIALAIISVCKKTHTLDFHLVGFALFLLE